MSKKIEMTAGILAGGRSSRMGENKAFLPWEGSTFLERTVKLFDEFEEVLVSVAAKAGYERIPVLLVEDVRKEYGPLEGLYRLLLTASHAWLFLAATDMPLLNRELINRIIADEAVLEEPEAVSETVQQKRIRAIIPKSGGRLHPLCGLYHRDILPVLEELFLEERHSMQALLERIPIKVVDLEEMGMKGDVLANINTPLEYKKVKEQENESSDYNFK